MLDAPSPFLPIADYGFLSNCHTDALVAPDGAGDPLVVLPPLRLAERLRQPAIPLARTHQIDGAGQAAAFDATTNFVQEIADTITS